MDSMSPDSSEIMTHNFKQKKTTLFFRPTIPFYDFKLTLRAVKKFDVLMLH